MQGIVGGHAHGQLRSVGAANDDGSCFLEVAHHRGILRGDQIGKVRQAVWSALARDINVGFDRNWNAVQFAHLGSGRQHAVGLPCFRQRLLGIVVHHRVEPGVVRGHACRHGHHHGFAGKTLFADALRQFAGAQAPQLFGHCFAPVSKRSGCSLSDRRITLDSTGLQGQDVAKLKALLPTPEFFMNAHV